MQLRRYIQKAVSRSVGTFDKQVCCVDRVYELLSEREVEDPGLGGRMRDLLSKHEFTRTPEWETLQDLLSSAVKSLRV